MHVCLHEEGIDEGGAKTTGFVPFFWIRDGISKGKEAVADDGMRFVDIRAVMDGVVMFITCNYEEGQLIIGDMSSDKGSNQVVDPDVIELVTFADFLCNEHIELS